MNTVPLASLVVLNYDGLKYLGKDLRKCLESVLMTNYPKFEVIFVDNASTDGSADFVKNNFGEKIRVLRNKENVIAVGYNVGINASKGEYIALLSNDMIFDSNWLKSIIELMEEDRQIGIAGCKRLVYGTQNIIEGLGGNLCICGRPTIPGVHEIDKGQYDRVIDSFDWIGGAAVVRRKTLEKTGLFDPEYVIFYEDVDLSYRIRKQGYKVVYVPSAVLWHRASVTINSAFTQLLTEYCGSRSRIRFALIHFTVMRLLATLLLDFVGFFIVNSKSKKLLLRAYIWNLRELPSSIRRHISYGPSPYSYNFPVICFNMSDVVRRIREIFRLHLRGS